MGKEPFTSLGFAGDKRSDALISFQGDNQSLALLNSTRGLRHALWRVESALGNLEARAHGKIDPDKMRPQFAEMFAALEKAMEEFFSLSLGVYGWEMAEKTVENLCEPFDFVRKMKSKKP